jgi:SAM-dependent methyltransferase
MKEIFDRALFLARQRRMGENDLSRHIEAELQERLSVIKRDFKSVCILRPNSELAAGPHDAIFSILDLHAVNDVPGYISQAARALQPDGLFLACLIAGDTLTELRQSWLAAETEVSGGATPRVAPMIGVRELGQLLQRASLALPVTDVDRHTLRYASPLALMREIKALGLANIMLERSRAFVSKHLLARACEIYTERFSDPDGRIRATLEIAWATAWSPHESQQQPLKPGSAKARLADALGVEEGKV